MELHPGKGVLKKRGFQTPGNTLTSKSVVSLGTTEGNITGRKNKSISKTHRLRAQLAAQMPAPATSKRGQGREAWAALLRVRTGPECSEGNLRELTWASKPDCGIAITQKALT